VLDLTEIANALKLPDQHFWPQIELAESVFFKAPAVVSRQIIESYQRIALAIELEIRVDEAAFLERLLEQLGAGIWGANAQLEEIYVEFDGKIQAFNHRLPRFAQTPDDEACADLDVVAMGDPDDLAVFFVLDRLADDFCDLVAAGLDTHHDLMATGALERARHFIAEAVAAGVAGKRDIEIALTDQPAQFEHALLVHGEGIVEELDLADAVGLPQMLDLLENPVRRAGSQHRHCRVAESAFSRAAARHDDVGGGQVPVGGGGGKITVNVDQVVGGHRILVDIHHDVLRLRVNDRRIIVIAEAYALDVLPRRAPYDFQERLFACPANR